MCGSLMIMSLCCVTGLIFQSARFWYGLFCDIDSGYAVAEGRPVRERRLGCCGLGCAWCL